jgi:hypothetical protein
MVNKGFNFQHRSRWKYLIRPSGQLRFAKLSAWTFLCGANVPAKAGRNTYATRCRKCLWKLDENGEVQIAYPHVSIGRQSR